MRAGFIAFVTGFVLWYLFGVSNPYDISSSIATQYEEPSAIARSGDEVAIRYERKPPLSVSYSSVGSGGSSSTWYTCPGDSSCATASTLTSGTTGTIWITNPGSSTVQVRRN